MDIDMIRKLAGKGSIKWTTHCMKKMGERDIRIKDVKHCIAIGEIIEDYPDDYPYPSCLIFGYTEDGRVIHLVVGCDSVFAYIVTAYIPNTIKFNTDFRTRRR